MTTNQPGSTGVASSGTNYQKRPAVAISSYLRDLAALGYSFRLNEAGDVLEANGKRLDDYELSAIRAKMRAKGYMSSAAVEDVIRMEAARNRYHPIRTYLTTVGMTWDGASHITHLAGHFEDTTTPHKMFDVWLRPTRQ